MADAKNLIHETSVTASAGNFTLSAVNGKVRFSNSTHAFSTGVTLNVFDYFISNRDAAEWEWGTGHMSDANTLVRDTVIANSNDNTSPVTFSAGTKDITNDVPASYQNAAVRTFAQTLSAALKAQARQNIGVNFSTVRIVATANVVIATAMENGDTLDSVTLATGDRVLLTAQSTTHECGIYVVVASGAASRAADFAAYDDHAGALIYVTEGTVNADSLWRGTSNAGGTLGVTAIAFASLLASDATTVTGTETKQAVTPANLVAKMAAPGAIGGTTPAAGSFTTIELGATDTTLSRPAAGRTQVEGEEVLTTKSLSATLTAAQKAQLRQNAGVVHATVRVVAVANVALASGLENGDTIDSVTLATGDRVLLTAQSTTNQCGIYVVVASGTASRAADFAAYNDHPGALVTATEGSLYGDSTWRCVSNAGGTIDSTALVFIDTHKSTSTVYASGSGTYTVPDYVTRIVVHAVGGGGGGMGHSAAGNGGNTTFGGLTASAGSGATSTTTAAGGGASGGTLNYGGGRGQSSAAIVANPGGNGGNPSGIFGQGGVAGTAGAAAQGATGHGGGGGGGGGLAGSGGAGGGAGGYCYWETRKVAASYSYAVGAAGTGGASGANANAGAAGAAGQIVIFEYYN